MLSAIVDPNPVLVLLPKALLRVRGEQLIPGEPDDEEELKEMIDAPVGDRSELAAALAGRAGVLRAARRGGAGPRGRRRHRRQLRPDAAAVRAGGRRAARRDGHDASTCSTCAASSPTTGRRSAHSVLKTGRVLIVNEDTEVTNFGEHLLRRVIDEHFYDLLVRPRVLAGQARPGHRPEPGLRAEHRAAAAGRRGGDAGGRDGSRRRRSMPIGVAESRG